MPYFPEDQSEKNLKKIRHFNCCAVCSRDLYDYLDRETHKHYLACPTADHEGIARRYEPPREDYQSNLRREHELEKEHGTEASRAVATIPKQGQLTQPQAMTILKLVYPNAKEEEIVRCAIFCRDFGLHPLANEVYLIPFKGKNVMVVGIPAQRKMAHDLKGDFSFLDDTPRAANEEEIVKQYGKDSEEAEANIISVTKLMGVGGNLAIGFGLYSKKDNPYGMDKGNTRRNMANIRSERQAMDRLPGKPMPSVEVIDAAYVEVPDVGKVAAITGEIIEAKATVIETEPEEKPPTELAPEPEPEPEAVPTDPITEEQIRKLHLLLKETGTDLAAFGKFCNKDKGWGIRDMKDLKQSQYDIIIKAFEKGKA